MAQTHPPATPQAPPTRLPSKALKDLCRAPAPQDDPSTLLGRRYLFRGGALLLVGPTGIGKSSLSMQLMLSWALGKPQFGIAPMKPLRSLVIQAENDEGDIAEMRDGVVQGLGFSEHDRLAATSGVFFLNESTYTGQSFLQNVVEPALRAHAENKCPIDLLWLDPALAFLGGDAMSQADVGGFLRNGLQPLLQLYQCGAVIIHHTNKRKTKGNDLSGAYQGAGSAEWANWARAVLILEPLENSRILFQLQAEKRGPRLDWKEPDGTTRYKMMIAHSNRGNEIFWREPNQKELNEAAATGGSKQINLDEAAKLLPPSGTISQTELLEDLKDTFKVGQKKRLTAIRDLLKKKKIFRCEMKRAGTKNEVRYTLDKTLDGRILEPQEDLSVEEEESEGG